MSTHRTLLPGTGRITLVLLAVVAATSAYPWQSARERWVLGIGVVVAVALLGQWRGLPWTTILRRRAALNRPKRGGRRASTPVADPRVTALLSVAAPAEDPDLLPLPLIAGYLDRYGLRADSIRITSRDFGDPAGARERTTWIGLTFSAVENLAALQARSPELPLHQTAAVVARRLADQLRESGWAAQSVDPEDIPSLGDEPSRETWHGIVENNGDHVAAYRITPANDAGDLLAKIWAFPATETWTVLEIAGAGDVQTYAIASALRTSGAAPAAGGPLPGLNPQSGIHRSALAALHPSSGQRLEGHTVGRPEWLAGLGWQSGTLRRRPADSAVA